MDLKVLKAVIKLELIVYKRLKIGIYTEGIKSVFPNWKPPGP
jgi:hypothetical protein